MPVPSPAMFDIKLCPSFQATQSNMNKAHGGNLPKFYDIVMKLKIRN